MIAHFVFCLLFACITRCRSVDISELNFAAQIIGSDIRREQRFHEFMLVVPFQFAFKRNYGSMRIKHYVLRQFALSRQHKLGAEAKKQFSRGHLFRLSRRRNALFSFVIRVYVPVIP